MDLLDELIASIGTEPEGCAPLPPCSVTACAPVVVAVTAPPKRRKKQTTPEHMKTVGWKVARAQNTARAKKSRERAKSRGLAEKAQRALLLAKLRARNTMLQQEVAELQDYLDQLETRKFICEL
jgi:hypothetical protein